VSSFATTSPAIALGLRLQRCATLDAGSFICRHARAPSILSGWHAQTPKPAFAELSQDHSTKGTTHLPKSAIASALTTVGTSSARQDMDQTKSEALWGIFPQIIVSSPRCSPLSKSYGKRLCCTNPAGDSLFESSMIAGGHEQLGPYKVQEHELVCLQ
jgi:hypothetical protein